MQNFYLIEEQLPCECYKKLISKSTLPLPDKVVLLMLIEIILLIKIYILAAACL